MNYPEIPEEIEPFLKYSRQVACAIVKDEDMLGIMKPLYGRMVSKHPEIEETLKTLTFAQIQDALRPYLTHPTYGVPVKVVIEGGQGWVERHLKALREEFL